MARYKTRHKNDNRYSIDDLANLHRQGAISDREYRRAGGICHADLINDPEYERDAGPGFFGKTADWGPNDLGSINSRGNKRPDKESKMRGKAEGNERLWPSDAQVRRVSAHQFHTDWYGGGNQRDR
jgi:hypothetical protein